MRVMGWVHSRSADGDLCALVVDRAPVAGRASPDGRAAREAGPLPKLVGQQERVTTQRTAGEITGFPVVGSAVCVAPLQHGPDELTVVAGAGCSDLPEVLGSHGL